MLYLLRLSGVLPLRQSCSWAAENHGSAQRPRLGPQLISVCMAPLDADSKQICLHYPRFVRRVRVRAADELQQSRVPLARGAPAGISRLGYKHVNAFRAGAAWRCGPAKIPKRLWMD